jgi:ComF family protein
MLRYSYVMGAQREMTIAAGHIARRGVHAVLNLLFPPLCTSCRTRVAEPHSLCASCWSAISFIEGALCARCGIPFEVDPGGETICGACHAKSHDFDCARSLLRYDDASKPLILSFKHGDRLDRAPAFARWMERTGHALLTGTDIIVPVPLHRWRLWKRRYNQAAVLALFLARQSGKIHAPLVLRRSRATRSQGEMTSAKARRRNVLGAFKVPPGDAAMVKGRNVLLIDDVFTTGATLNSCARALKRAGAARVDALTLARVVKPAL